MTAVVDASVVVAALVSDDEVGRWAERILVDGPICAPAHLPFEVANVLRRLERSGKLSAASADGAHGALTELDLVLYGYAAVSDRVWQLRRGPTAYDAAYVALAEQLDAPLATLDERLRQSPGLRCRWLAP